MAAPFTKGFLKMAAKKSLFKNPEALEHLGLGMLAVPVAAHGIKSIKEKDTGGTAMAGAELAGLGVLSRATRLAHKH